MEEDTMTRYWIIWALASFAAFIIPESIALSTHHPENTLSETLWRGEHLSDGNPLHWTFIHLMVTTMLIILLGWLVGHFGWGLWR
jgi:hypothetical protein